MEDIQIPASLIYVNHFRLLHFPTPLSWFVRELQNWGPQCESWWIRHLFQLCSVTLNNGVKRGTAKGRVTSNIWQREPRLAANLWCQLPTERVVSDTKLLQMVLSSLSLHNLSQNFTLRGDKDRYQIVVLNYNPQINSSILFQIVLNGWGANNCPPFFFLSSFSFFLFYFGFFYLIGVALLRWEYTLTNSHRQGCEDFKDRWVCLYTS